MQLGRIRGEQGQIIFIFALLVPVILAIGAIVVDLGNFYEHRRHLQTQVDAAALSGGGSWQFPCTQTVDDSIERQALKFSGVHNADAHRTETGGYSPAPLTPVNAQVGTTSGSDVHVTLNSGYWTGGSTPADYTNPAGSVCASRILDVKATETNTKAFFGLLHPDLKAKARVEVRDALSVDKSLPFIVASPAIAPCAWAVWVNDSTGAELAVQALSHPGTDSLVWQSPSFQQLTMPNAGSPAGPNIGIRLRIGNCTDSNRQEEYEDGTSRGLAFGQTYQTGAVTNVQTPKARNVVLQPSSANGCTSTSFVSSGATCNVDVSANVDFGGGAGAAMRATIGSTTVDLTLVAGQWVGGPFPIAAESGGNDVTLTWARGSGTWCNNGAASCSGNTLKTCTSPGGNPFAGGNQCNGSLGLQQRIYASDDNSGPVSEATILENGAPASSFAGGSVHQFLAARFVLTALENTPANAPPIVVRASVQDSHNRTGALDCNGNNLRTDIINGCTGYVETQRLPVCSPALNPLDCIPGQPGNSAGQVRQGMDTRFGCSTNNWPGPIEQGDPRVATIMITYLGALNRRNGNPQQEYPIVAFASFYITGWDGGQSCAENEPFPLSGSDADSVWGHFFHYTGPPSGGTPSQTLCDPNGIGTCIFTLVE